MFLVTLLLGVWLGIQEAPREIARWYLAAAMEHRLVAEYNRLHERPYEAVEPQNRADGAIDRALSWNPRDGAIYLERARWREEDGDFKGALADCEVTGVEYDVYELGLRKTSILAHLGRFDQAVQEAQKILATSQKTGRPPRPIALNLLAYMRSLGKVELPKALEEIDESLSGIPPASQDAARLDTRGFILYQMGRYDSAIRDFDLALPQVERDIAELRASRRNRILLSSDFRDLELKDRRTFRELAVIYYHRSLVLEKRNRWKEASASRRKANELLGREPDESVF